MTGQDPNVYANVNGYYPEQGQIGSRVSLHGDGKYRWSYEYSLFKNPTVFFLIFKIFFFIVLGIFAFMVILRITENGNFFREEFLGYLKVFGFVLLGMIALVGVSYLIYAAIMGGKYSVIFEMDDKGVNHIQTARQAKKARGIGEAAAVIGLASGNFGMAGAGIASQTTNMYSDFSKVKKVKRYPRRNLIKVNATLNHNQVYAAPEDYEFVYDFIVSRCDRIKK